MIRGFLRELAGVAGRGRFDAPLAPDEPFYAIGDLHGRADLLERMIDRLVDDMDRHGPARMVFLGDYVDRGDGSAEVLDWLVALEAEMLPKPVFLLGNHEAMLLEFLRDPERGRGWLRHGGLETLLSYRLDREAGRAGTPEGRAALAGALAARLGEHRGFIERLTPAWQSGNVLAVHAAADPALPPAEQDLDTLLWGHPAMGRVSRTDGLWVVHGHTVVDEPSARNGVIPLDTGACYTGRLTAARIGPDSASFIAV